MPELAQPGTTATEAALDETVSEPLVDTEDEKPRDEESQEKTQEDAETQPEDAQATEITGLKEEISKANTALATMSGRMQKAETKASGIDGLERTLRRINGRINDLVEHSLAEEPNPEALRQKQEKYKQEDALSVSQSRVMRRSERLDRMVGKQLTRLGLDAKDARFVEPREMWDRANGHFQGNNLDQADDLLDEISGLYTEIFDDIREDQSAESATENKRRQADTARKNGPLNVDGGRTAGAGQSDTDLWKAYGLGKEPWSKRVREAGQKLGAI